MLINVWKWRTCRVKPILVTLQLWVKSSLSAKYHTYWVQVLEVGGGVSPPMESTVCLPIDFCQQRNRLEPDFKRKSKQMTTEYPDMHLSISGSIFSWRARTGQRPGKELGVEGCPFVSLGNSLNLLCGIAPKTRWERAADWMHNSCSVLHMVIPA